MTARVDVGVGVKTEGFAKLRDETGRLNESARKGMRDLAAGAQESERQMSQLGRTLERVARSLDTIEQRMRKVERATSEATQKQGAFMQGVAQGAGVGQFIQRGPGMTRQIVGTQVGRTIAAPARLTAGAFGGVGSFTRALQNTPVAGLAAAPLGAAMGYAQQAVGVQQARLAAAPFLGGMGMAMRMRTAGRGRGAIRAAQRAAAGISLEVTDQEIEARIGKQIRMEAPTSGILSDPDTGTGWDMLKNSFSMPGTVARRRVAASTLRAGMEREARGRDELRDQTRFDIVNQRSKDAYDRELTRQRRNAVRAEANSAFGGIRRAGVELGGMEQTAAFQFAGGLAQQAGGRVGIRDIRTSIAAQTLLGVGGDVTGQFLRAVRRGGMVGAQGAGMTSFTDALTQAMQMGLEGSEINDYLAQMAAGIQAFEQTGIPINAGSISGIGQVARMGGVEGVRAARVGGAVQRFGQRIAQSGPQDALDMMMLRAAGFQGGGMQEMFGAMQNLEQGIQGPQFAQILTRLAQSGGSDVGGAFLIQRAMGRMGANVQLGQAMSLSQQARAGGLNPDDIARMEQRRKNQPGVTTENLEKGARTQINTIAPTVKQSAALQNKQADIGAKMFTAVKSMEETMTKMAGSVTNLAGKDLGSFMQSISSIAGSLEKISGAAQGRGASTVIGAVKEAAAGVVR